MISQMELSDIMLSFSTINFESAWLTLTSKVGLKERLT